MNDPETDLSKPKFFNLHALANFGQTKEDRLFYNACP